MTYLHAACRNNDAKLAQDLLDRGAHVNQETTTGYTPLHVACRDGYLDVVRCLLDAGAKVDAEGLCIDGRGTFVSDELGTPLDVACRHGHRGIVELLLGHEPAVDVVKDDLVVACREGHVAVVELLLAYIACVEPESVYLWIDQFTYRELLPAPEPTVDVVKHLLDIACREGHVAVVELLLGRLEPAARYEWISGGDSISAACTSGKPEVARLLLDRWADLNMTEADLEIRVSMKRALEVRYMHMLYEACSSGKLELLKFLLTRTAPTDWNSATTSKFLVVACRHGHRDIVQLLLEHEPAVHVVKSALVLSCEFGVAEALRAYIARVKAQKAELTLRALEDATPVPTDVIRDGILPLLSELLEEEEEEEPVKKKMTFYVKKKLTFYVPTDDEDYEEEEEEESL